MHRSGPDPGPEIPQARPGTAIRFIAIPAHLVCTMDIAADILSQAISGGNLPGLVQAAGGDSGAVTSAIGMAVPAVVGSMAKTASAPGGADMLAKVLSAAGSSGTAAPSAGLAGTVLGGQMGTIQTAIAGKTGLPPAAVGKVLEFVVPMVVNYLGKMFVQQNVGAPGLAGFLGEQAKTASAGSPDAGALAGQLPGGLKGDAVSGLMKNVFGR